VKSLTRARTLALALCATAASCLWSNTAFAQRFPLKASPNTRYLVDQDGVPFLYNADTPWFMPYLLSRDEVIQYLDDRKQKGINTIQIMLLPTPNGPALNRDGQGPFVGQVPPNVFDFSRPNDPYFDFVKNVILVEAGNRGMQALLMVAWDGYQGGDWARMYDAAPNTLTSFRSYGQYLGTKFLDSPNVFWGMGGDHYSRHEAIRQMALGIRDRDTTHLITDHSQSSTSSYENWGGEPWLSLNLVYTYPPNNGNHVYADVLREYKRNAGLPVFLGESTYENEWNSSRQVRRRHAYWTLLSGGCGVAMGNHLIWFFGSGWQQALQDPTVFEMQKMFSLFSTRRWYDLAPDYQHLFVTAGYGKFNDSTKGVGDDYVTAAVTPDGKLAVAYAPVSKTLTVDLGRMSGPVTARWYDPVAGTFRSITGSPFVNSGKRNFATPGRNADPQGAFDFALVLEAL
jgi:hypothetical protein